MPRRSDVRWGLAMTVWCVMSKAELFKLGMTCDRGRGRLTAAPAAELLGVGASTGIPC